VPPRSQLEKPDDGEADGALTIELIDRIIEARERARGISGTPKVEGTHKE